MGIAVRKANESDAEWLLSQLQDFSRFYGTNKQLFPENTDHARGFLSEMIANHLCLVAGSNGECVGFIAGFYTCHPFNPEIRMLTEAFWWVPEAHRKSKAALMLLNAFVSHGEANADWVVFTLEHHSPVSDRCLTKRGFKLQERQYLKEVG